MAVPLNAKPNSPIPLHMLHMHSTHFVISIAFAAILLLGITVLAGCTQESAATVETQPTGVTVHFDVGGMHCDGCAALLRSTISRVEGVERCAVSYPEESAEVVLARDDEETIGRIIEAVAEEGFTIERKEDRSDAL